MILDEMVNILDVFFPKKDGYYVLTKDQNEAFLSLVSSLSAGIFIFDGTSLFLRYTSSYFKVLHSLSMKMLSNTLPLPSMLMRMP